MVLNTHNIYCKFTFSYIFILIYTFFFCNIVNKELKKTAKKPKQELSLDNM